MLPHVFALFTQAARLALVKSIVTLHNGRINATSPRRGGRCTSCWSTAPAMATRNCPRHCRRRATRWPCVPTSSERWRAALRALHPEKHPTFIALSDPGQSHDKVIARGAGFDYMLERPLAMGSLRKVLPQVP